MLFHFFFFSTIKKALENRVNASIDVQLFNEAPVKNKNKYKVFYESNINVEAILLTKFIKLQKIPM